MKHFNKASYLENIFRKKYHFRISCYGNDNLKLPRYEFFFQHFHIIHNTTQVSF